MDQVINGIYRILDKRGAAEKRHDGGDRSLQLLLDSSSATSLIVPLDALVWCSSDALSIKPVGSFLSRLFSRPLQSIAYLSSNFPRGLIVCLQRCCGDVMMLRTSVGLYCLPDVLLCCCGSDIELKSIQINRLRLNFQSVVGSPRFRDGAFYVAPTAECMLPAARSSNASSSSSAAALFVQSGSALLTRSLAAGESIVISVRCLAAWEASCSLSEVNITGSMATDNMIKVVGPGIVYFSGLAAAPMDPFSQIAAGGSLLATRIGDRGGAYARSPVLSGLSFVGLTLHVLVLCLSLYTICVLLSHLTVDVMFADEPLPPPGAPAGNAGHQQEYVG